MIVHYLVESFTSDLHAGNPAGVCLLDNWISNSFLQTIATENALPETAFIVGGKGRYRIRWFTPEFEIDLCGHATLAAAWVIRNEYHDSSENLHFTSSSGDLTVSFNDDKIVLVFPRRVPEKSLLPEPIASALSIQPIEVFKSRDYILLYQSEREIRDLTVSKEILDTINLDPGGVCITAQGADADFVSRYFIAQSSILEDPVTGSAHCSLIPFWSERLSKREFRAIQLSERGGELFCEECDDHVKISGRAVLAKKGSFPIPDCSVE